MPARTRPIQKFAAAVSQCSPEAAVYGKCIVADYNSVHKDKCVAEFMKLKDCYLVSLPRSGQNDLPNSIININIFKPFIWPVF
ncbi:hypothetical protein PG985_009031 [Apiospora marii]|uniref:uncharacterized protein n=1 Tax=Apiospora marii TaxID=335849 RepID=UPI00313211EC